MFLLKCTVGSFLVPLIILVIVGIISVFISVIQTDMDFASIIFFILLLLGILLFSFCALLGCMEFLLVL